MFAIYARVSTDEQTEKGTINSQIAFAKKYCNLYRLEPYKIYREDGISGTIPFHNRPTGSRLLEDAKKGLFSTLLVYRLDRLGRSMLVTLNIIKELENLGIQVKSMTEEFDTTTVSGKFTITTLASIADYERTNILSRMHQGIDRAAKKGKWVGGIVPYGYILNNGYPVTNNVIMKCGYSEADVIKLIYSLIVDYRYSSIDIALRLNELHIPAHTFNSKTKGKRKSNVSPVWRPGRIRGIISNTIYKGVHYFGKHSNKSREIIERKVPAIIDTATWEKAQLQLTKNVNHKYSYNIDKVFLLSGIIKCGLCGRNYIKKSYNRIKSNKSIYSKYYYYCSGKNGDLKVLSNRCYSKNIDACIAEQYVFDECISLLIRNRDVFTNLSNDMYNTSITYTDLKKDYDLTQKELNKIEEEKESILDLYRKKVININDVSKQIGKINKEYNSTNQELITKKKHIQEFNNRMQIIKDAMANITIDKNELLDLPDSIKRNIILSLVKEVTVNTILDENNNPIAELSIKFYYVT
ncbi:serine recombinase [Vallitalea longa]|uniref:Serine recombinase n=1 Tax=Vallitalea longa TaxID=2936439 RepID=A0A9W6DFT7_9FIRM|nr:recombinase family protein [Vallitalea longa]GKX29059.1 serine recombinase [Vallitalea longa]